MRLLDNVIVFLCTTHSNIKFGAQRSPTRNANTAGEPFENVDLNDVIKDVEVDLELSITESNAKIHCQRLPVIEGAAVLLYQLFYNLLINSIKFVPAGTNPVIDITNRLIDKGGRSFVEIAIQDNGIGFEPEEGEKIFQVFTRLNSKDQFEGTGLGLALCKKIVERHEGTIRASGEPGKGAVFTIQLPLVQRKS